MLWIHITLMRIRIRLFTLMQIRMRIWILIFIWCGSGCGSAFPFDADPDTGCYPDADADQVPKMIRMRIRIHYTGSAIPALCCSAYFAVLLLLFGRPDCNILHRYTLSSGFFEISVTEFWRKLQHNALGRFCSIFICIQDVSFEDIPTLQGLYLLQIQNINF